MISNLESQQFLTLFLGKTNSYVKNELPKERPERKGKFKTKITQVEGKVDKELMVHHLEGDFGVGICPVNAEGKARFGVLDFDIYSSEVRKVLDVIREYQLPLLPFRSKSGGLHVYLMLIKAIPAKEMRDILERIKYNFSFDEIYGKNKVEVFPKQNSVKEGGFGSAITLPYFNAEEPYTYLLSLDGEKIDFKEALIYIQKHITTVENVTEILDNLPYNDAPPCIQRILLSEAVGGEDTGRNNFLFSFAVYAKKKYGTGFESYVEAVNEKFSSPLAESDVTAICTSVSQNEYIYKCSDIPCNSFCNKVTCKKREYGLGRDKSHFTGIDYGQLFRYQAAEPYYIWKLRLHGQEEWKDVVFKDEGYLLDQKNFAKLCVRYLNQAPMQVSSNDWYAILNSVLPNIQNVEVTSESDTSGLSVVRNAFISYLSNKQARRDSPYQIRVGLCVRQTTSEGEAKYYFTHKGFYEYLRNHKIDFEVSLLRETLKKFGAVEDVLIYTNALGEEKRFPCWSKEESKDIAEAYEGIMEIEKEDKAGLSLDSISEASNKEAEEKQEKAKSYSEEDRKEAEEFF